MKTTSKEVAVAAACPLADESKPSTWPTRLLRAGRRSFWLNWIDLSDLGKHFSRKPDDSILGHAQLAVAWQRAEERRILLSGLLRSLLMSIVLHAFGHCSLSLSLSLVELRSSKGGLNCVPSEPTLRVPAI